MGNIKTGREGAEELVRAEVGRERRKRTGMLEGKQQKSKQQRTEEQEADDRNTETERNGPREMVASRR